MDIKTIIADLEKYMPVLGQLAADFDPAMSGAVLAITQLAPIVDDFAQKIAAIRAEAEVDPALMEQVAAANVAADDSLIGN